MKLTEKTEDEKLLHRRECEDFLYESIEGEIILKRMPLKKQKEHKENIRISRADYTFLQYGFLIRKWAMRNYKLTPNELDILIYIYPLTIFNYEQFVSAQKEIGMSVKTTLKTLEDRGLIIIWSKIKNKVFYVLSHKIALLISRMHRMYMLEEEIPMSVKNVIRKTGTTRDNKLMELFSDFNKNVK